MEVAVRLQPQFFGPPCSPHLGLLGLPNELREFMELFLSGGGVLLEDLSVNFPLSLLSNSPEMMPIDAHFVNQINIINV